MRLVVSPLRRTPRLIRARGPRAEAATGTLKACGTLLLERKLIRGAGVAGHVEDVVVDASARGTGVGKLLLDALVARARQAGCYKARGAAAQRRSGAADPGAGVLTLRC